MRNARNQAESYAKSLPAEEGWPPFLVIVDVGHVIELYADFSLQGSDGKTYKLSSFKGKQAVVLAWFPKAFTGG